MSLVDHSSLSWKEITLQNGLGFRFNPPNEFANPDSEIREFDNTIELFIPNESTFQYVIKLNDTETVTLDFLAELTKIPCNITYYTPTGVVYNTQNLELREGSSLEFITDIELWKNALQQFLNVMRTLGLNRNVCVYLWSR